MTTMTLADPNEAVHARQQSLQQRVLLLAPSFGCWRGYYQLSEHHVDVRLDNVTIEKGDATTPRAILMKDDCPLDHSGKAWRKRFREIENRQSQLIAAYSLPFSIRGVRLVPRNRGYEFFAALIGPLSQEGVPIGKRDDRNFLLPIDEQSVAYQLERTAAEFCDDLPGVYAQIARDNPQVWEAVHARLPETPQDMRDKFYVDAVPVELAGSAAGDVNLDELETHNAVVRDACRRKVEEAIETMVAGPRLELAEALAGLQSLISRDGRVTAKSFGPVRAAIAKIRLFDFVANADLLQQIEQLEGRLNITSPTTLDSVTAANNGFSDALQALHTEITDEERQAEAREEFGRDFRSIDL